MTNPANDPLFVIGRNKNTKKIPQIIRILVGKGTGNSISQFKRDKILARDGYRCRGCDSRSLSRIYLLTDTPPFLSPKEMSPVSCATLCPFCRIRLFLIAKRLVINEEQAFDFWCRIYHSGIYEAQQHLNNL